MPRLAYLNLWRGLGWLGIALVFTLSLMPHPPHTGLDQGDKIGHFLAYALLAGWFGQISARRLAWGLGFLGMGAMIEVLQGMTGYRDMSLADLAANALGLVIGSLTARRFPDLLCQVEARLRRTPS